MLEPILCFTINNLPFCVNIIQPFNLDDFSSVFIFFHGTILGHLSVIVQSINTHLCNANKPFSEYNQTGKKKTNCPSIKHARFYVPAQIQFIIYIEFLRRISIFHFLSPAPSICSPDVRCREHSDVVVSTVTKAVKTMVFYLLTNAAVTKRNDLN
jgi:hypothetical protein